jgi:hypothetical protein
MFDDNEQCRKANQVNLSLILSFGDAHVVTCFNHLAHLVEHPPQTWEVMGSNPIMITIGKDPREPVTDLR